LDPQSYFIAASLIEKCRSDKIVLIHENFAKLPVPFPEISDSSIPINVFACIVGWSFNDMKAFRLAVDYSDQIKVLALCCKKGLREMNFSIQQAKDGAIWEEQFSFPCYLFKSREQIQITIYAKIKPSGFNKRVTRNSNNLFDAISVHPLSLAFQLLSMKLSSHFHRFENQDYLAFGEYGVSPIYWNNRVDSFLTFCTAKHSCGRIVEWNNNSCWMNSCLALVFNQPIIRKMVNDSKISVPRRLDILEKSNPDFVFNSMLMLMLVYCKNTNKNKSGSFYI
jgi:hypothetical protein